jgi:hypothetical protein
MQQLIERFKNFSSAQQLAIGGSAAVLLILLITAVAVAGGGDEPVAVTSTTTSTTVPTESTSTSTAPESTTTTTTEPGPIGETWPLTGMVDPDAVPTSPILVAKIDNSSASRPQTGLGEADMVVEVLVEGGVARFLAFFQSTIPEEIGPIRSTREVDPRLIAPFDVVFAYSGGIPANVEAVQQVAIDAGHPSLGTAAYSRDPGRPAPYDLMLNPAAALDIAGATSGDIWFRFEEEAPVGEQALTVEVALSPIMDLTYRWSSIDQGFLRFHGETAHVDDAGEQMVASNVVVLAVDQFDSGRTDGAGNAVPDYQVTGTGTAFVFRNGVAITGSWERGSQDGFFRVLDEAGQPIPLAPGNVWIELMPTGRAVGWQ